MDWLNQVLADHDLPNAAFKVAYAISRHMNEAGEYNRGTTLLARRAQVTQRSLRALIKSLAERGHLEIIRPGGLEANIYRPIIRVRGRK